MGVWGKGTAFVECIPKVRHENKGPVTVNGALATPFGENLAFTASPFDPRHMRKRF